MHSPLIPAHRVGSTILDIIDFILRKIGLENNETIETVCYTIIITVLAVSIGWILRRLILWSVHHLVQLRHSEVGDELINEHIFTKCSHIIPPIVFLVMIPFAFDAAPNTLHLIEKFVVAYLIITLAIAINAVLTFFWVHYDRHENNNHHPLRGLLNTAHGIVWIIAAIVIVSLLVGKSPGALLAGLGAFAAALMLVFKDSILGLVAGIQLSQNDMLRVGDWVEISGTPANGNVEAVTLTTVKVRNFDNTVIYVPPYTLVSTSFRNWRGMYEKGERQIEQSFYVDNSTIKMIAQPQIEAMVEAFPILKPFVDAQSKSKEGGNDWPIINHGSTDVNGTIQTNLGLFRAYISLWLHSNPEIADDVYLIVRILDMERFGTPLEIYCFSKITQWGGYEGVRSSVIEHVIASAKEFGLTIYNSTDSNTFVLNETKREGNTSDESATLSEKS